MNLITQTLYLISVIIITIIVHELAHYYACKHYGVLRGYGIWRGNPTIDNSDYNWIIALVGFFSSIPLYPLIWLVPLYGEIIPFSYWVFFWAICSGYDFYQFFKYSILRMPYVDETFPIGDLNGWWIYFPYKGDE